MKYYTLESVEQFIQKYLLKGGELTTLQEGSLGYGVTLLHAPEKAKLKTFVIQERYLNEWSSTHTVRGYNKMPKKYIQQLDKIN